MITTIFQSFGLAAAAVSSNSAVLVQPCDAGELYAFSRAPCQIALTNSGRSKVKISGVRATTAGDSVTPSELTLGAGEQGYLQVTFEAGGVVGNVRHTVRFTTSEKGHPELKAAASAFVMSILDDSKPELDFGVVDAHAKSPLKELQISSHDIADVRATSILDAPDWLDATVDPDGRGVKARIKPDARWGLHVGYLKVALNATEQNQVWIEAKADVHGDVVPSSNPVDMGLLRIGNKNQIRIPLRDRSDRPFEVGKVRLDGMRGSTSVGPCENPADACRMLEVEIDEQNAGPLKGELLVDLPGLHQQLSVKLWGLLVPPDLKIKTVDPSAPQPASNGSSAAAGVNLSRAVRDAVSSTDSVTPGGRGPLLRWTIANGAAIHGFQIFRSNDENGPFVLLNKQTVPSKAKTQDSVDYSWRDTSAVAGETYWYSIGIVYNDGHKQQLTGPQKVVAK